MTQSSDIRVAVSTVILTLRRTDDGRAVLALPLVLRTRGPSPTNGPFPAGGSRRPSRPSTPRRAPSPRPPASPPATSSSSTPSAPSTAPHQSRVDRVLGTAATGRRDGAERSASRIRRRPENVKWFDVDELPQLAFDHTEIVEYALWRLRNKVGYSRVAQDSCPRSSRSPSCGRPMRRSSTAPSIPPTSVARWRQRATCSPPTGSAPEATAPRVCIATTPMSSWPIVARSVPKKRAPDEHHLRTRSCCPPLDASVDHAIQAIVSGASTDATCATDLAAGPWDFDARPGYGPGSSMGM